MVTDELKDNDDCWRGIVEGLHEQIRDLEQEIRELNRELNENDAREYDRQQGG